MLWIVGIWHGRSYIRNYPFDLNESIFLDITVIVLATFIFLSGYLQRKKTFKNKKDVVAFFKKRFYGLYVPFFVACTLFLILHYVWQAPYIKNIQQYFLSLVGLSLFLPPPPQTIWFVVLLIPYYLVTPLILKSNSKICMSVVLYFMLLIIEYSLKNIGCIIDYRIAMYFPIYCFGLCFRRDITDTFSSKKLALLVSLLVAMELMAIHINSVYKYLLIFTGIFLMIEISKILNRSWISNKLIILGYISLEAFLFHRIYFYTFSKILGRIDFIVMYIIIMPTFFYFMYKIRAFYDSFLERMK